MPVAKDYYKTLGLSRESSVDDVRRAFKKLARKHHPDVNPGDKKAEEKFKELSEAYEVLSNPDKKKKYDTYGTADFEGFPGGGPFGGGRTYTYSTGAPFDLGDLGDIFGDLFTGGAGGGRKRRSPGFRYRNVEEQKGKDLHFSIDLEFMEAIKGADKTIHLPNGVSFRVKIPPGVTSGQKIRLVGKGEPGLNGGEAGDLYISPHVMPHPYFRRAGDDIEMDLPVTVVEALEGATIRIPTPDGPVEMKIPKGTQSGKKFRLKGKGALSAKDKSRGDFYVVLLIHLPCDLDHKTREALVELLKKKEKNPRQHIS